MRGAEQRGHWGRRVVAMNWYQSPTERAGVGAGASEHKQEDESDWHGASAAEKGRRQGQSRGGRPDPKCQSLSKAVTPTKADSPAQGLRAQEEQEGHPSGGVGGSPAGCQSRSTGRGTCAEGSLVREVQRLPQGAGVCCRRITRVR